MNRSADDTTPLSANTKGPSITDGPFVLREDALA